MVASAAIFACRFTGMAREIVYTSLFGATGALDAFYTAFRIPNLLRDLFAEGALSQSYTSVATKTKEQDGDQAAWELTNKIASQLSTLMIGIVTVGILLAGPIVELLYSGKQHSADNLLFATELSRYMWPFIGFASLSALVMGALNMMGIFGLPMLASAAFNITSVIFGLVIGYFIDPTLGPKALVGFACGVTLGGIAQVAVQLPKLRKSGFRWQPNFQWKDPKIRKIWGLTIPSVVASGVTQFTVFINTGFALSLQDGSVTALSTAFRLWQLPVGLFGVATGMVVLPAVSRMMVGDGKREVASHVAKGLRLVAFFALPSFIILGLLGTECISALFQWGNFNTAAVQYTGQVLAAYSLGLLGYAGTKVVQPVFLALEKRWVPLIAASVALCISIGMNYYFVHIAQLGNVAWLALTTSVVTTFNFLFYFFYLRHHLGGIDGRTLFSGLARILPAGLALGLVCWGAKTLFLQDYLSWNFFGRILSLGAVCACGGIVYLITAFLLKTPELDTLRAKFLKRR